MTILTTAAEVHITFGPHPLPFFSYQSASMLNPHEYPVPGIVRKLRKLGFKLVEARRSANPALTGSAELLYRSPDLAQGRRVVQNASSIWHILRGVVGEPWIIQMAEMPCARDGVPDGRTSIRIHLMPHPEDRIGARRDQAYACETLG